MFFKYKTQTKYTLFSVLAIAVGILIFKPTNVYAVTQSNTRQAHTSMYTHYHDGYSISINDGVVQGGGDDARYNVDADNYWMDGFSARVWGDYSGSISYSIHCHNLAWTSTFANGVYVSGPGYFGSNASDWRAPYAWIEAITVELSGDVNNFYYFNYEAYPVMATYNYVDRTTMPAASAESFPLSKWQAGSGYQRQWRKPGMDWNEAGADMANWNGKNWIGTTGCAMPLCGARGSLTKRPCTVSINPNGGTLDNKTDTQTYNCKVDETFSNIGIPTRAGYTFTGWKVDYTWQQTNAENGYQAVTNNYAPRSGGLNGTEVASGISTGGNFTNATLWVGNCKTITLTAQWQLNNYNQTINYYTYNAKGSYKDVAKDGSHYWTKLGSKNWSIAYGSTFDANSYSADWGNVDGYHWWSINNTSWTVTGAASTNSHYYPNKYRLTVDVNGGSGTNGNYDMEYGTSIDLGTPTRTGWEFTGWTIVSDNSSGSSLSGNSFTMGYAKNHPYENFLSSASINIQAQWRANTYTLRFDGNGADSGSVADMAISYDADISMPMNGYALDRNTFVGWTLYPSAHVGTYFEAQNILSSDIIDAAGMTAQNNAVITLYCAWDPAANIRVRDKTFTLEEARNGLITEERLFEDACAMDEILDREILPGTHDLGEGRTNSFTITNYSPEEFPQFTDSGSATITYQAVDSVGNVTEKTITVYIVNNEAQEPLSGEGTYHVRFISDEYYDKTEEEGGLMKGSIWRTNPEYAQLLRKMV